MLSEMRRRNNHKGFTLLEVLVALTIAGMALGALLSVIGGNKRLAWRSEDALLKAAQLRSHINLAQLDDGHGAVPLDLDQSQYLLRDEIRIEDPERKTQPSNFALRSFELVDADGEIVANGTYWVELALPE